jgi:hypothetical protein
VPEQLLQHGSEGSFGRQRALDPVGRLHAGEHKLLVRRIEAEFVKVRGDEALDIADVAEGQDPG